MLVHYHCVVPSWSGNVQMNEWKGTTAESAFLAGRYGSSRTAYANDIRRFHPRIRGGAVYLECSYGQSLRTWGMDTIPCLVERSTDAIRKS
jgi:hypothetical protein